MEEKQKDKSPILFFSQHGELRIIFGCLLFLVVLTILLKTFDFGPYIIGFFIGVVWCSVTLPFVVYYVYKFQLQDDVKDPNLEPIDTDYSTKKVKIGKGLAESLKDNKKTFEAIIEEDGKKKEVIHGKFHLQLAGKVKSRKLCAAVLKGNTLFYQIVQSSRQQCMILSGAFIRKKEEFNENEKKKLKEFKFFVELFHPSHCLLYKIDYVFLIFDEVETRDRWYFALLTVCSPFKDLYTNVKFSEIPAIYHFRQLVEEYTQKKKWNITEPGTFVDALFSRFFIHIQESLSIKRSLIEYISLRLSETIEEKGLQERFSHIFITNLSVGSKAPSLTNFTVSEPHDLSLPNVNLYVHFFFSYTDGDASLGLQAKVAFLNSDVLVKATVTLKTLEGPMTLICYPYPMAKMGFSFDVKPQMVLDVNVHLGGHKGVNYIPDTIKSILQNRFNYILKEKLVAPNWKFVRIPGVTKNEPAGFETTIKIRSSFLQDHDGDQMEREETSETISETFNGELPEIGTTITTTSRPKEEGTEKISGKKGTVLRNKIGKMMHRKKNSNTEFDSETFSHSEDSSSYKTESLSVPIEKSKTKIKK